MRMMIGALMMMTATGGCATEPAGNEEVPVRGETGRTCDAAPAQHLVGRPATQELAAEAMRLTGAGTMRWIPEGGMVTMDYREDRLNIELDGQNRVKAIRCG